MTTQVFELIPAGPIPLWLHVLLWSVAVLALVMVAVAYYSIISMRSAEAALTEEGLRLRGGFYGRTIPYEQLRTEAAEIIPNLRRSPLALGGKRFGTKLGATRVGWFGLERGGRALCYVTANENVVHIPVRGDKKDYALLISPRDPKAFLQALNR
jgi:hypothetical protein